GVVSEPSGRTSIGLRERTANSGGLSHKRGWGASMAREWIKGVYACCERASTPGRASNGGLGRLSRLPPDTGSFEAGLFQAPHGQGQHQDSEGEQREVLGRPAGEADRHREQHAWKDMDGRPYERG